jgi:predicted nucleic acid-binding Zn ribbon protein
MNGEALFRKRRRILGIVFLIGALIACLRCPFIKTRWPGVAEHAVLVGAMWSFVVAVFFIRAWRCPVCGGGIKLDGKTCSKCGRVFR